MQAAVKLGRRNIQENLHQIPLTHPAQIPNPSKLRHDQLQQASNLAIPRRIGARGGPIPPYWNSQTPEIGHRITHRPRLLARVYGPGKRVR
uniref:Uncharacterized protein n=1 Tax=Arundo donax TaxID=35708 RepID=A0A0A9DTR4_ARUDO